MKDPCARTVAAIREMPREAFVRDILRTVAKTEAFSKLVTLGAEALRGEEREALWDSFRTAALPIPAEGPCRGAEALETVAEAITARAVTLW